MRKLFITLLIAVITVASASAQKKTAAPQYIINGQRVEHFDGSQLRGKIVSSYVVDSEKNTHTITTVDGLRHRMAPDSLMARRRLMRDSLRNGYHVRGNVSVKGRPSANIRTAGNDMLYVVDGKVVPRTSFYSMSPSSIDSIDVIKNRDDERFKKYTSMAPDKTYKGVIEIKTRKQ